jgi:uncharacterized protein (TIGR00730 family)
MSNPDLNDSPSPRLFELHERFAALAPSEFDMGVSMVEDFLDASAALHPFVDREKVVIFGSARITNSSNIYASVRTLAGLFADSGYVVITGGGPGVMSAGLEGAGTGNAIGISVELPFESPAEFPDIPVITQQRFFTRKLAMVRKTKGIIVVPGGFGTLDEMFEVLTLLQTGKKSPTPVVLLDPDNSGFFDAVSTLFSVLDEHRFISPNDLHLFSVATTETQAFEMVKRFWSNYVSFTGDGVSGVVKLTRLPDQSALPVLAAELDAEFEPFAPFRLDPSTSSVVLRFDKRNYGLLHRLIRRLNEI